MNNITRVKAKAKVKAKVKAKAKKITNNRTRVKAKVKAKKIRNTKARGYETKDEYLKIASLLRQLRNDPKTKLTGDTEQVILNLLKKYLLLEKLLELEYETNDAGIFHFEIDNYLKDILIIVTPDMNFTPEDKTNKDWGRILGKICIGLNEHDNTDNNYNIIKKSFIILVNKILDLKLDDSTDIFNDANIYVKLIKPLFS